MDFKDVAGLVGKLAPTIAAGLGGPLAGTAVAALEGVFGLSTDGTTADKQTALAAAITGATPDQLLAMKKADQDYAVAMQKLGFDNVADLEKIAAGDRDSARKRETEVKDSTPRILACAITIGFFASLGVLMFGTIPASSRDILNIMLGTLGTAWIAVVTYYYGSTAGSSEKTKLLAASTPTVAK